MRLLLDNVCDSCGHLCALSGELRTIGQSVIESIRQSGHYTEVSEENRQVLALAEECGEFVGAYRRYTGQARRTGTREELEDELVDVILTAFATAYVMGMDTDRIIERGVLRIFKRGWKEGT